MLRSLWSVKELMNLNIIFIQIHTKYTIVKKANPNISLKVAMGAGRKLISALTTLQIWRVEALIGCKVSLAGNPEIADCYGVTWRRTPNNKFNRPGLNW